MHQSNLLIHSLPEHRFQSVNADFGQKFSDSRKKFICRPELLSLEAVFEMSKHETRKGQRELSPVSKVDVMQFAKNCHRKTLLSLLPYMALHCSHARPTSFHFSPRQTTISVRIFRREETAANISAFGMAWHGMA
jgi:hypothetical protein